jgi:NADPH-dependent curcumin reductase CurA
MTINRRFLLVRRPQGAPVAADFELREAPLTAAASGSTLKSTVWYGRCKHVAA